MLPDLQGQQAPLEPQVQQGLQVPQESQEPQGLPEQPVQLVLQEQRVRLELLVRQEPRVSPVPQGQLVLQELLAPQGPQGQQVVQGLLESLERRD